MLTTCYKALIKVELDAVRRALSYEIFKRLFCTFPILYTVMVTVANIW